MTINEKKQVVTTCDELMNHTGWSERVSSRHKAKGHGNAIFRVFELDCGNDYRICIAKTEAIGLSLSSLEFSKPYVTIQFSTMYGKMSHRHTIISDCKSRNEFYWKLYNHLAHKFPLTDADVQSIKVD